MVDLPAPDGPTIADRLAGRHLETEPLENRTLGIIGEPHIVEAHIA